MAGNIPTLPISQRLFSPLFVLFLGLFIWVSVPVQAVASTACGIPTTVASGYFFTSYESISHTQEGFPIIHLKIQPQYADGRPFTLRWSFQADDCQNGDLNTYQERLALPSGVTDWSVRFTSTTHFDVWDDQHEVIVLEKDISEFPGYYHVSFFGFIDGGASTIGTPSLQLVQGTTPPIKTSGIPKPTPCSAMSATGYYFDSNYEQAEYIDGLLRIHLRLKAPYNDGRNFTSAAFVKDDACATYTSQTGMHVLATSINSRVRYFSFRMVTPTHFELWDDENNKKFGCIDCAGDVPEDAPFVGWYGTIDGGASYITSTPFPPTEESSCATNCFSSVLFLPGIQSSRLYTKSGATENQLWEPGIFSFQSDAKKLNLDAQGQSINQIYTKADGAIGTIDVPLKEDIQIYASFLNQLSDMQSDRLIEGYKIFPYDWRMDPIDIVEQGAPYEDGTHFVSDDLETLAEHSKTGKVTIVAHSNGGLVAKALMLKLQREGKANLVDKILFVGTPQLGTPKAVASMLNGDFQNIPQSVGFVVSKENARELARNMPGAYGLLPSNAYFAKVASPVVTLTDAPVLQSSSGIIDSTIDDFAPFQQFMTGGGRQNPPIANVEKPILVSGSLFAKAALMHDALDAWQPPIGVQAIQIAGWGLQTPSGITYTEKKHFVCPTFAGCFETTDVKHSVEMTEDGDGTVVTASADTGGLSKTYFVNLYQYDKENSLHYNHSSITETAPFQNLFSGLMASDDLIDLPQYIHATLPDLISVGKRLHVRILSPVSIDAYDSFGNHTGLVSNAQNDLQLIEAGIPNSYYEEFGEGKYIGLPADGTYKIDLKGLDLGTFTLELSVIGGGEPSVTTTYKDLPVSASSTGSITVAGGNISEAILNLDINGDGIKQPASPSSGTNTNPTLYIGFIKESVQTMNLGSKTKKQLLSKLSNTEQLLMKSNRWDDEDDDGREPELKKGENNKLRVLKKIDKISLFAQKQLAKSEKKQKKDEYLSQQQAAELLNMLSNLKTLVQ